MAAHRPHRPVRDDVGDHARAGGGAARGGRRRHRLHRLARRHRRLVPRVLRLPAPGRRAVRDASGPGTRAQLVEGAEEDNYLPYTVEHHRPRPAASDHRGHRRLRAAPPSSTGCCTTTSSTCSPPRRIPTQPWHPWHRPITSPGDLDPSLGRRPDRRDDTRAQPRRARAPERPHRHRKGNAVGDPHRIGIVGLGVISRAYLGHARRPSRGAHHGGRRPRRAPAPTALAAELPGAAGAGRRASCSAARTSTPCSTSRSPPRTPRSRSAAIANGKHVYGEKPLAATFARGARDRRCSGRRPACGVGCAPDTVLGTGTQTARAAIDAGLIGRPLAASAVMVTPGHERWHPNPDFYYRDGRRPAAGHGARTTSPRSSTCSARCAR